MARIAIFCDGTWSSPTMDQPTHVARLFDKTPQTNAQRTHYFEGVGVEAEDAGFFKRAVMKLGGGAFGWGLDATIKKAYAALCEAYEPGDEIFIFGFSRGAYTARSLAGMVRKCGIVADPDTEQIDRAFRLYRRAGPENHPDALHILAARRRLSPRFATSQADMTWRAVTPWAADTRDMHRVQIAYLGIWDTVGALGVPAPLLGPVASLWNAKYRFHDLKLSSLVKSARHAVGLDERRVFYRPALWENLEASRDDPGLNKGDRSENRPYKQVWFTGNHAIVGGSAVKARKLTGQTLAWIAEGAAEAGLQISEDDLLDVAPDPLADSHTLNTPPWYYTVAGNLLRWREGPGHPIDLHPSAQSRVEKRRDYRPRSLRNLQPDLFGEPPIGVQVKPAEAGR
ncbi:DUF2235 domain-containing protein [uncultured Sulfitobacter sp.]|uniref:DUF2235 domain-containing protein n=1 Tax=uncultured Sulfitobacter sp. TaxID=191468 RepID=UPI0026163A97|nr:DUF2235 domain-containing protein [uncultured Sulfitobacter sp.]